MIHDMSSLLDLWANDANIKAIILRGAGEKAFCAGGDIRALYDAAKHGNGAEQGFFRREYELNFKLHRYPHSGQLQISLYEPLSPLRIKFYYRL